MTTSTLRNCYQLRFRTVVNRLGRNPWTGKSPQYRNGGLAHWHRARRSVLFLLSRRPCADAGAGGGLVFDTLRDAAVPANAVMLGGGFPERWMHKLSQNKTMRESVCAFVDSGKPLYAECGGLMYLCRSLEWGAERVALCGAAGVTMRAKPQGRGCAPGAEWTRAVGYRR